MRVEVKTSLSWGGGGGGRAGRIARHELVMQKTQMQRAALLFCLGLLASGLSQTSARAFDDDGFEGWVKSRNPAELCELFLSGMIDDEDLPSGRAQDPCVGVHNK